MKHVTVNRFKMKSVIFFAIFSTWAIGGLKPEEARAGSHQVSAGEMSEIWRNAFEKFAEDNQSLTQDQEQFIWQAFEMGSVESFNDQQKQANLVAFLSQNMGLLAKTQIVKILTDLGPMQPWLANHGYAIPFCNCSTIPRFAGCLTPCALNGQGVTCIPNGTNNGMCITQGPS